MSLKDVANKNQKFLNKKNVVGIGAGKKYINGTPTGDDALVFFVENKVGASSLSSKDLIPNKVEGYQTDVFNIGKIVPEALRKKVRPIQPGYGCSHSFVTAGTIGGLFLRKGNPVLLSNNHVIANSNKGKIGNAIINPANYDGGNRLNPYHRIARLHKFKKLKAYNNYEDSAIGLINPMFRDPSKYTDAVYKIGRPAGMVEPSIGLAVQKTGRTTGYTTGKIVSTGASVSVTYGRNQIKRFKDCIITTDMSRGGDSGSLLFDMNNRLVGLLFAGSSKVTIHNPIKYPMKTYDLEFMSPPLLISEKKVYIYKDGKKIPEKFSNAEEAKQFAISQMKIDEDILKCSIKSEFLIERDLSEQIVIVDDDE